jgi:hypothetical protein
MTNEELIEKMENVGVEKFGFVMHIHFPNVRPGQVEDLRCEVCQDFKEKHCTGQNLKEKDVIVCMVEKADLVEFEIVRLSMN